VKNITVSPIYGWLGSFSKYLSLLPELIFLFLTYPGKQFKQNWLPSILVNLISPHSLWYFPKQPLQLY